MAFKDRIRALIENHGGMTEENLVHIAELAREVEPDFTMRYLINLLNGFPPRNNDFNALGIALGVSPSEFLDHEHKKIEDFVCNRMKRPDLAQQFHQYVVGNASFRNKSPEYLDLYPLFHEFLIEKNDDE